MITWNINVSFINSYIKLWIHMSHDSSDGKTEVCHSKGPQFKTSKDFLLFSISWHDTVNISDTCVTDIYLIVSINVWNTLNFKHEYLQCRKIFIESKVITLSEIFDMLKKNCSQWDLNLWSVAQKTNALTTTLWV